jgi:hypothetical protein
MCTEVHKGDNLFVLLFLLECFTRDGRDWISSETSDLTRKPSDSAIKRFVLVSINLYMLGIAASIDKEPR